MREEREHGFKPARGKLQKISLELLTDSAEDEKEREQKLALEDAQGVDSKEEKIIVEKVKPQIKTILSEPEPVPVPELEPPSPAVAEVEEDEGLIEGKSEDQIYQMISRGVLKSTLGNSVSITVKAMELLKADLALLRFLMGKHKMKGIIICGDRPVTEYFKLLQNRGLSPDDIYYIDIISLLAGYEPTEYEKKPNVTTIRSPSDLTTIDIAITQAIDNIKKEMIGDEKAFLLLDCLASMQMYNTHTRLGMFVHNQITKLKIRDVCGIIFLLRENEGSVLSSTIQAFCDRNIKIYDRV